MNFKEAKARLKINDMLQAAGWRFFDDENGTVNVSVEPDSIRFLTETAIGSEGVKIDRKLYEKFEETIREDEYIKQQVADGDFSSAEQYIMRELFDKPDDYIIMDKLATYHKHRSSCQLA